jgi:hypothetical protein
MTGSKTHDSGPAPLLQPQQHDRPPGLPSTTLQVAPLGGEQASPGLAPAQATALPQVSVSVQLHSAYAARPPPRTVTIVAIARTRPTISSHLQSKHSN